MIRSVDAIEVTIPIEAPLRHSYGVHEAFTRTIVRMTDDDGNVGLGETAASAARVRELGAVAVGLHPFDLRTLRMRVAQRFYWSSEALVIAALEMAAIDLQGKITGLPAAMLLGGPLLDDVPLAAYCFFRHGTKDTPPVDTPEAMAAHAAALCDRHGFTTVKLKGGVLDPAVEVRALEAMRERLGPHVGMRFDPNAAWTVGTAISHLPAFERIGLEYLEDPSPELGGMARVRSRTRLPLATNMVVTEPSHIAPAIEMGAVDVVLGDLWYWGGPTRVQALADTCATLGLGLGMHSGIELGIGMAAMAHVAVTLPNVRFAIDAHYHQMTDDVIVGDRLLPDAGRIAPPDGPGWGVELDDDKVDEYAALHAHGHHANVYSADGAEGPDPFRPSWRPVMPAW